MTTQHRVVPLWAGRTLALIGILLVAANLRTAVTAVSPITAEIRADVAIDAIWLGVLGMLPPVCFAVFGLLTPRLARATGLESAVIIGFAAVIAGNALRALSTGSVLFLVGSMIALAGMGIGNVLLPALVKRYFPDRIGLMTTLYATILSMSTFVPPLVAGPVAEAAGWRVSLGQWAVLALIGMLPWLGMLIASRRSRVAERERTADGQRSPGALPASDDDTAVLLEPGATGVRIWRSKVAWAILGIFTISGINAYAVFAWLPQLLVDRAGVSALTGGALLSLYGLMGLPLGLIVPILASRARTAGLLVRLGALCFIIGNLGLLLVPAQATWLWVCVAGLGQVMFPMSFVLISLRTRTHEMAAVLSGFVQGIGYGISAVGPLLFSLLNLMTGSWAAPLVLLMVTAALAWFAARPLSKPTMVEEELGPYGGQELSAVHERRSAH